MSKENQYARKYNQILEFGYTAIATSKVKCIYISEKVDNHDIGKLLHMVCVPSVQILNFSPQTLSIIPSLFSSS